MGIHRISLLLDVAVAFLSILLLSSHILLFTSRRLRILWSLVFYTQHHALYISVYPASWHGVSCSRFPTPSSSLVRVRHDGLSGHDGLPGRWHFILVRMLAHRHLGWDWDLHRESILDRPLLPKWKLELELQRPRIFLRNYQIACPFFYRNSSDYSRLLCPMWREQRTTFPSRNMRMLYLL